MNRSFARVLTVLITAMAVTAAALVTAGPSTAVGSSTHSAIVKTVKAQTCPSAKARLVAAKKAVKFTAAKVKAHKASKAQLRKKRAAVKRAQSQVVKVCGVAPVTTLPVPGGDNTPTTPTSPAAPGAGTGSGGSGAGSSTGSAKAAKNAATIARFSSPETAARTPEDAVALVKALAWTAKDDYLDDYKSVARMVGQPLSAEKLTYCEGANWCPQVAAVFAPVPGMLVSLSTDPRTGDYMYNWATEYTDGWDVNYRMNVPLQVREVADASYPNGVAHEVFNPTTNTWFRVQGWQTGA